MTMNFSEFLESLQNPLYEVKGKGPKCPGGHRWDKELKKCVPDDSKRGENPGDKAMPGPMTDYTVWGATGIDGDGYALAEDNVEEAMTYHPTEKDKKRYEKQDAENKAKDDRMKYGKSGKPQEKPLRPGEVKKWDDIKKRWVSNKEGK